MRAPQTMLSERVGDVLLAVHGADAPTDAEWHAYLHAFMAAISTGVRRVMVVSRGGGLSAAQRRLLADAIHASLSEADERVMRTAVCTSSTILRGMVSALAWLTTSTLRAFRRDDWSGAFDYLQIPLDQRADLTAAIVRLDANIRLGLHPTDEPLQP